MTMDDVTLYLGDCLDVMRELPDGCVDAVVTDPPYGVNLASGSFEDTPEEWLRLVPPIARWADERGVLCIVFGATPVQARDLAAFHRPPERTLVWNPSFSLSQSRAHGMFYRWHPIYCWNIPQRHEGPAIDVLRHRCDGHNWWDHPGTKPLSLMMTLVSIALPGATILDPFVGSGTTGVACIKTGRRFIGCEIDEHYYAIAEKRIREAQMQPRLPLAEERVEQAELLEPTP